MVGGITPCIRVSTLYAASMVVETEGLAHAEGLDFKLVITEVRNFPEIAQFYVDEVIKPSHAMLSELVQRGIDRGGRDAQAPGAVAVDGPAVLRAERAREDPRQ